MAYAYLYWYSRMVYLSGEEKKLKNGMKMKNFSRWKFSMLLKCFHLNIFKLRALAANIVGTYYIIEYTHGRNEYLNEYLALNWIYIIKKITFVLNNRLVSITRITQTKIEWCTVLSAPHVWWTRDSLPQYHQSIIYIHKYHIDCYFICTDL